ncbi:glycoside hydrolase family 13 protein [Gymnopilus junonius]|uniref:Glycoside hydrolase family 13 protein n=1 Tax=Gymnopilus junonius TaxID=109634 RepID=A0A9P5NFR2_GYMJU|nr:glycoside hydrolase family 13 protein [Gymnopilus junonius]
MSSPQTFLPTSTPNPTPPVTTNPSPDKAWWKEAVIYQIYPISFFDSNGDGIGDLNGIHAKLDYLRDLGVDVLWLSPIYRSPLADMGYDVSDYKEIDLRYGTLADWDNLLRGVHDRGMKLMMDLVINHTSDEHDWFLRSRSSKSDPKRDWYIWRPPKYDSAGNRRPPNNWKSTFQGSAWEYDEKTEEYYLHIYVLKQPDLNWDNPDVREAAWDVMQFWIDRGCDGFRMDVINLISKVDGLPDAPITVPGDEYQPASMFFANGPRVHQYIKEMHAKVLSKKDLITVGETPFTHDASELAAYALPANKELQMVFHFELMDIDSPKEGQDIVALKSKEWKLDDLRSIVTLWQQYRRDEGFWNAVFIENHDHSRSVSRFGNDSDEWRALSAKMLAILQVTQSGTQFIYQGQELALKNFPGTWGIEEYKDVASLNYWNGILTKRREESGKEEVDMSDILDDFKKKARDHSRVPMQWDSSSNAGFTAGKPWMRVNEDYEKWNIAAQLADDSSVHAFWKQALRVRKQSELLIYGEFTDISEGHPSVFAYARTLNKLKALILLNFTSHEVEFDLPRDANEELILVLGNYEKEGVLTAESKVTLLRGYEGRLYFSS